MLDPSSCAFITKWNDPTKGSLEYQWPLWGIFEVPKLNLLNSTTVVQKFPKQNACFDWYFETSKHYQEPKIVSLQNKILTKAGN